MGAFFVTGMTDVTCPLEIHPDWSFREQETLILSQHRTQRGVLYSYRWADFHKYHLPLRFVNSSDRGRINGWWKAGEEIAFTLDSSETEATLQCRIQNGTQPIDRFVEPYQDLFAGVLQLESLDGSAKTRRPFVLDDEVFGLLDQNYNALL